MSDSSARHAAWLIAALLASTLIGCAQRGTVVLLPEKDGRPTAVVVKQNDKETVLDKPYAAMRETPFGSRPYTSTAWATRWKSLSVPPLDDWRSGPR